MNFPQSIIIAATVCSLTSAVNLGSFNPDTWKPHPDAEYVINRWDPNNELGFAKILEYCIAEPISVCEEFNFQMERYKYY